MIKQIKQPATCQDNCRYWEKILIMGGNLEFCPQLLQLYSFVALPHMHFSNLNHQFLRFKVPLFWRSIPQTTCRIFSSCSQCFSNEVLLEMMK